jgi:hypothetical protein
MKPGPVHPAGQFLFDTFTPLTDRAHLAVPPAWNAMTGLKVWEIEPGTPIIRGRTAPQLRYGGAFVGGESQIFVLQPWKYGSLK